MSIEALFVHLSTVVIIFAGWAANPSPRVLMPRFLTWFYRYLILHTALAYIFLSFAESVYSQITFGLVAFLSLYCVLFHYFDANDPDRLPIGIKLLALVELAKDRLFDRSGSAPPDLPDAQSQSRALEPSHPARSQGLDLAVMGTDPLSEDTRGRLWAIELLLKAQKRTAVAKREFNEEAIATLRSDEQLHEAMRRSQHWKQQPEVIAARAREDFETEADERAIRRAERQERLADQERARREAEGKLEATEAQIESEQRRRQARLTGDIAPPVSAEERFRQRAEQIVTYGSTGRFMPISEEWRIKLIAQRGGEEHLTDEDRERIELLFAEARRLEESKS